MKKLIKTILITISAFILVSCGTPKAINSASNPPEPTETAETTDEKDPAVNPEDQNENTGSEEAVDYEELREEMKKTALANPWGETQSLDVATETSGVSFTPPEEDALPDGLKLTCYRYMEGIIEALYENGENRLTIRKSGEYEGAKLLGDYNEYAEEWTEKISGIDVTCSGKDGLINSAVYDADNAHYAVSCNPGEEGKGITAGELQNLIGEENPDIKSYTFRTPELRLSHFEKHGIDMGFTTEEAYEEAASRVISNPKALHRIEAEDGDDVYYIEDTNEFVVLSTDGFIRTYFCPDRGKAYFVKQ